MTFADIIWGKVVQCGVCPETYRTKRKRKYCGSTCRQRAHRARKRASLSRHEKDG